MRDVPLRHCATFNGPVEIGLRALCVLTAAFPSPFTLERLVVFDYLVVHSDDLPAGPKGLHPRTPSRAGEILVRRGVLQEGLSLYESRGLVATVYTPVGILFAATDSSGDFLDAMSTDYARHLRDRADWLVDRFVCLSDSDLVALVREQMSGWRAECAIESMPYPEEDS